MPWAQTSSLHKPGLGLPHQWCKAEAQKQVSNCDMHLVTANIWGDEAPQTQTA